MEKALELLGFFGTVYISTLLDHDPALNSFMYEYVKKHWQGRGVGCWAFIVPLRLLLYFFWIFILHMTDFFYDGQQSSTCCVAVRVFFMLS